MRLVRLAQQPSRVADDIRAALASLGRGNTVVGGVALIGVRPFQRPRAVDAIVVLPRGVLVIIGVDLPDPAMRLHAPLEDRWKADGWPLVAADDAVNPATEALALAESITGWMRQSLPETMPIGTIVAVGPFVETVDQPAADLAGSVRVLHPTPTSMLAASVSLASAEQPCTVAEARTLLKVLAPDAPEQTEEVLLGEGFRAEDAEPEEDPLTATTVTMPAVPPAPPRPVLKPAEVTAPVPRVTAPPLAAGPVARQETFTAPGPRQRSLAPPGPRPVAKTRQVRWLPLAAVGLLAVLLIAAIVVATTGGFDASPSESGPTTNTSGIPASQAVEGIQFAQRAADADQRCASHAYGDVQASLQRTSCASLRRGSFEATVDGRVVAVSVAVVTFTDDATAAQFKKIADTPGSGGILDLATETGKWSRQPAFDGAAYTSGSENNTANAQNAAAGVRLVLAAWVDGPSTAEDPDLVRTAGAGLSVPLS